MINAGELRDRVQIERDVITHESGIEHKEPSTIGEPWGKGEALAGNELWRAQQVNAEVTWRWTFRWNWFARLKASDRIVWGALRFEIKSIVPNMRDRDSVTVLCKNLNA